MSAGNRTDWFNSEDVLRVTFHPRPERPDAKPGDVDVLDIPVAESVVIGARFYSAGPDKPTLLFFHGNGEIVADYDPLARFFVAAGVNFLPAGYRGYGRSTGRPAIPAMLSDARSIFSFARTFLSERGYTGPVIVMGRSLGSASALEIAAAYPNETAGLILDSAFADALALLERLGARLPAPPPEDTLFRQAGKISRYPGPTLLLHGERDRLIPVGDAQTLFDASPAEDKRLVVIRRAGHNDMLTLDPHAYMDAVGELIRRIGSRGP